jgi:hypothetical protein
MSAAIRRALLSVSDKRGLAQFAAGLQRHGIELLATGGTAQLLIDAGLPVREISAIHRLSRTDGRAAQDTASARARRPAGPPRQRRAGDAGARHRADRPAGGQSVSVRRDHRAPGLQLPAGDREHRRRWPGDAARRGQESCRRHRSWCDPATTPRAGRDRRLRRHLDRHPLAPRSQGVRAHRALRHRGGRYLQQRQGYEDEGFDQQLALYFDKQQDLRYGENPHQRRLSTATRLPAAAR